MAAEVTLEEHFAGLAMQFRAKASVETGRRKAELEHLAECYMQLGVGAGPSVLNCDKSKQLAE